jgi:uncharacterized protein YjaZ
MKRFILTTAIIIFSLSCDAQNDSYDIVKSLKNNVQDSVLLFGGDLKLFYLYKNEFICLYDYYVTKDREQLNSRFYLTAYGPFASLWNMFGLDSERIINYLLNNNFDYISKRINTITSADINTLFIESAEKIYLFTGYKINGQWYIGMIGNICGMCGNGDIMFIDLLFGNVDYEFIKFHLAHEFNHMIFIKGKKDDPILNSLFGYIINEGFATYINYVFWNKVYSPAKNLMYTEDEYKWCLANEDKIFKDAEKLYLSKNREDIKKYQFFGFKVYDDGPSMLAYYIGFRLCEKYVEKYGKDSWKDFYKLSFSEILNRVK